MSASSNYKLESCQFKVDGSCHLLRRRISFFPRRLQVHQQDLGTSVMGFQSDDTGPHPFPKWPQFCKFDAATGRNM